MDSPQGSSSSNRNGSRSSALGQAHSGGHLNTKPTLLRIGEASALPVLLCGLLQKEALLQQQQQQQHEVSSHYDDIDAETFEEEFFGLLNQRYAQMTTTSGCLLSVHSLPPKVLLPRVVPLPTKIIFKNPTVQSSNFKVLVTSSHYPPRLRHFYQSCMQFPRASCDQ